MIQSVSGQQLLAVDVAVTTMLKQIDVPQFLVEELRKTGSRSIRTVADLARELKRSQARALVHFASPHPDLPRPARVAWSPALSHHGRPCATLWSCSSKIHRSRTRMARGVSGMRSTKSSPR